MHIYTVREPFAGFVKGDVLTQAQVDAYEAKGGHVDHHLVRLWRSDPPVLASAKSGFKPADLAPAGPS